MFDPLRGWVLTSKSLCYKYWNPLGSDLLEQQSIEQERLAIANHNVVPPGLGFNAEQTPFYHNAAPLELDQNWRFCVSGKCRSYQLDLLYNTKTFSHVETRGYKVGPGEWYLSETSKG
jgi:hypothetical protein